MNTVSTAISRIGVPGLEIHVLERPCRRSRGRSGSAKSSGDGTLASIDADLAGVGAPRDVWRQRRGVDHDLLVPHRAVVGAQRAPVGERPPPTPSPLRGVGRDLRGTRTSCRRARRGPACAPASIDMLHTVIRPSIDSARIAEPRYSMTWPMPPPVPIWPMIARMMSLAVTPGGHVAVDGRSPSTSAATAAASGWPARARPRSCRCRTPARRTRRGSRCGCRRTRSSCRAACGPARDR